MKAEILKELKADKEKERAKAPTPPPFYHYPPPNNPQYQSSYQNPYQQPTYHPQQPNYYPQQTPPHQCKAGTTTTNANKKGNGHTESGFNKHLQSFLRQRRPY